MNSIARLRRRVDAGTAPRSSPPGGRAGPWPAGSRRHRVRVLAMLFVAAAVPGAAAAAPAWTPAVADAPCTWHVRLAYHYREAGLQGTRDTQVLLNLEAPLLCAGSGTPARFAPGAAVAVRGRARLTGNVPHAGGPPQLRDTYDKTLAWPAVDAAGALLASIELPAPSFVGEGYATQVNVSGLALGTQQSAVADPAAAARDAAAAGKQRALQAAIDPASASDRLDLALYFDPLPGTPSDPAGAIAQVPQRTAEALNVPGGEAALAYKGHLYGARTNYNADGSYSICYQRSLALPPAALDVDFCGWLTRAGQDWVPEHLPQLDPPPANALR